MNEVEKLKAQIAELEASLKERGDAEGAFKAQIEALTAQMAEMKRASETEATEKATLQASLKEKDAQIGDLVAQLRRQALQASMTDEEWEAEKSVLLAMDKPAFELFARTASAAKKSAPAAPAGIVLDHGQQNGKRKIELG